MLTMAQWECTINSGTALREAIYDGSTEQTVKCLLQCYTELYNKLNKEDKEDYEYDIEDTIEALKGYIVGMDEEDEENINYYLEEFYDICDSVRAFVAL